MLVGTDGARRMLGVVTDGSLRNALPPRDGFRELPVTAATASNHDRPVLLVRSPSSRADRALRLCSVAVAAWLLGTVVPVVHYARETGGVAPVIAHVFAAVAVVVVLIRDVRAPQLLRDWLPLASVPFLYLEARWPIAGLGRPHADAAIHAWELAIFPSDPSRALAVRFHSAPLSEVLHAAYLSYYALIYLPPLVLYVRGRREEFAETNLALAVAFAMCFTSFLVFPVDGPRFMTGAAAAPDGPIRTLTLALLNGASTRGTAFPSLHVAASVVASACALRFVRPLGYGLLPITVALMIATVYGGFHYAVDVWAGVLVGAVSLCAVRLLWTQIKPSSP